jgi:hypothetical protein
MRARLRSRRVILCDPPYRQAATVLGLATLVASVFAVSYSLALGRPVPRRIPAAVVGGSHLEASVVAALQHRLDGSLVLRRYPSVPAARRALDEQRIFAALLARQRPTLLLAGASGVAVARLLVQAASGVPRSAGGPLRIVDLHPLPSTDPQGLDAFYATIAATLLGFVTMFQLRANAAGLPLRGWLVSIATLCLGGGLVLTTVTSALIGALHGSFPELWAALAAEIAAAALFNSAMLAWLGRWAILPTWLLFVAIGNAASGGAVAAPLLPPFYRFVGRFLPNGATVETIRNIMYFPHQQHLEPALVEAAWLSASLLVLLVAARRGRVPASS